MLRTYMGSVGEEERCCCSGIGLDTSGIGVSGTGLRPANVDCVKVLTLSFASHRASPTSHTLIEVWEGGEQASRVMGNQGDPQFR